MKRIIAILSLILVCFVSRAQTNTPSVTSFQTMFGLYNTNLDVFTNSFTFDFKTGLSMATIGQSGLQQEFEPSIWKHISGSGGESGNLLVGFGVNADMLGQSGGQGLDGAGVHGYFAYAKYNLEAYTGAGWYKNVDTQTQYLEIPFGVEAKLSQHAGVYTCYNLGVNLDSPKSTQSLVGRVVAGVTWAF